MKHTTHPLLAAILLATALLAGCHDSSSGGKKSSLPSKLPPIVQYVVDALVNPVTFQARRGLVEVEAIHMTGLYDLDTEGFVLDPGFLFTLEPHPVYGPMDVWVTLGFEAIGNDHPTAGQIEIIQDPWVITVTVNPDVTGLGDPGVDVTSHEAGVLVEAGSFVWSEFEITGPTSPLYQQIGWFGFLAGWEVSGQVVALIESLNYITANAKTLQQNGHGVALVEPCDFMPGPGLQGQRSVTWLDDTLDGKLGAGDRFTIDYDECWVDDPADDYDRTYDGLVTIRDFITQKNPFESGGQITYLDFVVTETEDVGGAITVMADTAVEVNGGFDMLLTD